MAITLCLESIVQIKANLINRTIPLIIIHYLKLFFIFLPLYSCTLKTSYNINRLKCLLKIYACNLISNQI